jgi:hypothetical protein
MMHEVTSENICAPNESYTQLIGIISLNEEDTQKRLDLCDFIYKSVGTTSFEQIFWIMPEIGT